MRTRGERRMLTDRIITRRVKQLKAVRSSVPHERQLADDHALGRCGHRRCICHWIEKNRYEDHRHDEVA